MTPLEQYIRQAAAARGIDPEIAVRVAKSEGGLNDPIRQSGVMKNGAREPSYGPFQLLIGGGGSGFPEGLGNRAVAAGIDPRNPNDAYRGIDFALDEASKKGWGQWYGAKAAGLGNFAGIGGAPSGAMPQAPGPMVADGPKGQEAYPAPLMGSMMAGQSPNPGSFSAVPPAVQQAAAAPKSMNDIFGMMAAAPQQGPQFSPVQIMGPSAEQANALSSLIQALKGRMA
ncbi:hypothetical protein ELG76_04210 [Rhizobium leguminosarum]|uniref:hypothetical protein n=1 Tax=Rhizobium leguminosarum TaxID=384 RepID=UPI00102FE502|nr:hypothetical protein [Rhizobium leguminosarum]TBG78624.1 hypothetical protein ELG76_04210 [Rhizobium leguminosarum]